uniref:Putative short d7 protein n=1 Tax=Anopheles nuneztovari TaxID=30067 RepID=A0A2M3YW76_9DIPT
MKTYRTIVSVFLLQLVVLIQTIPLQAQTVAKCISDISDSSRTKVCDLRHYRPARGVDADRFVKCALAAIGLVADDGSVQRNVVLSALDEVESHDGIYTDSVDVCLSRTRKLSGTERPNGFFSCMLTTESAGNFQDALELRELKTASQWPEHQAFDRTKVQQQMQEVNRQLQCK